MYKQLPLYFKDNGEFRCPGSKIKGLRKDLITTNLLERFGITVTYSIVKDSSADLGVNSKIVLIRPTVKAVSTKISKGFFCIFVNILIFLRENIEASFFLF